MADGGIVSELLAVDDARNAGAVAEEDIVGIDVAGIGLSLAKPVAAACR